MVSYIPSKFARYKRVVRLKQPNGTWDCGWVVEHVGSKLLESELPNSHRLIKTHRQATGDSLSR